MRHTLKVLLTEKKWSQILRYLVVGGFNTLIVWVAYYFGSLVLHWGYIASSALCSVVGIGIGFYAQGKLVFNNKGIFYRYLINWGICFVTNTAAIGVLVPYVGQNWAPIILLPLTTVWSYFLLKYYVYKP